MAETERESSGKRERAIMRITLWGAVGNCILTALKVAAGIVGNSAAMIADGVHSLSDLISDFVVIVFVHISSAERDEGHKYGHGKFETLATLAVSLILLGVGIKLMQDGISDIIRFARGEDLPSPDMIALYMALVSIAAKEVMYQLTVHVGKKVGSQVVVANAWHHRSDAISSVGSMIGIGGAILLGRQWVVLDPIASCIISLVIFFIAVKMSGTALNELLEASLSKSEEKEIVDMIQSVQGLGDVHNLKTRHNGHSVIIDVHVVVCPDITVAEAHEMTVEAEKLISDRFGQDTQIFIHIEPSESSL